MNDPFYKQDLADEVWPYNLILEVKTCAGIHTRNDDGTPVMIIKDELPSDIEGTIAYLLCRLTDREQNMLLCRYKDGMTLEQIGRDNDLTKERVRQIINKTIRKMSHGAGRRMITSGLHNYFYEAARNEMQSEIDRVKKEAYANGWNSAYSAKNGTMPVPKINKMDDVSIMELDFSVRTYNALKHYGIRTVKELNALSVDEIKNIRNLGCKCCVEIFNKLTDCGYDTTEKEALLI